MMTDTSDQVIIEFTEEEMATLLFFADRHRRWKSKTENAEIVRQHRIIADTLKDTADTMQALIDLLKDA
jgi:predicted protein tyrosine phosphatase